MSIATSSPTRVDLAGGTLDCWPLYNLVGSAQTTNLAIGVQTYCELKPGKDQQVHLQILDLNYEKSFRSLEELLAAKDRELDLIRAHVVFWRPKVGFSLRTKSESPVGGGLGGSSSLCISLIKAFSQWLGRSLSVTEMVTLAHNLEAQVLRKPTGTQDYFPAVLGGLNVIHYTAEGPRVEPLAKPLDEFSRCSFLVYTGQPHHSGLNNWQVIKKAIDGDVETLKALHDIKTVSDAVADVCRAGQWRELPALFQEEFRARVRLSSGFSSPQIEDLAILVRDFGATVKICGAGGGGCVLVWASASDREQVEQACQRKGFQVLSVRPVAG